VPPGDSRFRGKDGEENSACIRGSKNATVQQGLGMTCLVSTTRDLGSGPSSLPDQAFTSTYDEDVLGSGTG
jgi:hypothetical protein